MRFVLKLFGYVKPCRPKCYVFEDTYDGKVNIAECRVCGARHEV